MRKVTEGRSGYHAPPPACQPLQPLKVHMIWKAEYKRSGMEGLFKVANTVSAERAFLAVMHPDFQPFQTESSLLSHLIKCHLVRISFKEKHHAVSMHVYGCEMNCVDICL